MISTMTVRLVLLTGALLVACGGSTPRTIQGEFTLTDEDARWTVGQSCRGDGGYGDIREGAQVRVEDAGGAVIGTGSLGDGVGRGTFGRSRKCGFVFEVENLPKSDFYSIEVTNRGGISYSHEELETRDWEVSLTLGD